MKRAGLSSMMSWRSSGKITYKQIGISAKFLNNFSQPRRCAAGTCKPWRQRQKSLKVYESQTEERAEWQSQQEETRASQDPGEVEDEPAAKKNEDQKFL